MSDHSVAFLLDIDVEVVVSVLSASLMIGFLRMFNLCGDPFIF